MKTYFCGTILFVCSLALADDAKKEPIENPVIEVSESDSTTWRLCFQDPTKSKMPIGLSMEEKFAWIEGQRAACKVQANVELEASKYPSRELQLKSGSAPKDENEKLLILKFQQQKVRDEVEAMKQRLEKRLHEINLKIEDMEKKLKSRSRQLSPSQDPLT